MPRPSDQTSHRRHGGEEASRPVGRGGGCVRVSMLARVCRTSSPWRSQPFEPKHPRGCMFAPSARHSLIPSSSARRAHRRPRGCHWSVRHTVARLLAYLLLALLACPLACSRARTRALPLSAPTLRIVLRWHSSTCVPSASPKDTASQMLPAPSRVGVAHNHNLSSCCDSGAAVRLWGSLPERQAEHT